jgi:hypothetical protein
MGYEVKYFYHERTDDGFDKSETKEMVKRLGTAYEEVPAEKLAGSIMSQLVRRDIWVVDVEVYEYAKKQVAFKESKGGVVIKGKKYSFDGATIVAEEEPQAAPQQASPPPGQSQPGHPLAVRNTVQAFPVGPDAPPQANVNLADQMYFRNKKPLRSEIYNPDQMVAAAARQRRLPFTIGKQYPIYEERLVGSEVSYITINDLGQKSVLNHRHFIVPQKLTRGFAGEEVSTDVNLDYGNPYENMPMPDLR